jgi:hypothetical protein
MSSFKTSFWVESSKLIVNPDQKLTAVQGAGWYDQKEQYESFDDISRSFKAESSVAHRPLLRTRHPTKSTLSSLWQGRKSSMICGHPADGLRIYHLVGTCMFLASLLSREAICASGVVSLNVPVTSSSPNQADARQRFSQHLSQ